MVCSTGEGGGKSSTPMYHSSKGRVVDTPCIEADEETPEPTCSKIRKKIEGLFIPTIDHLTDEEFDQVPKYVLH